MKREKLVECSFLIPIRSDTNLSDGLPHSRKAWRWLDDELYEFGGATRANERYTGWYLDPDTGDRVTSIDKVFRSLDKTTSFRAAERFAFRMQSISAKVYFI